MENFNKIVNDYLGWIHNDKLILPIVSLFLFVYVTHIRPKPSKYLLMLFENSLFRIMMLSYILYRGNSDTGLSMMVAVIFLVSMHYLNRKKLSDHINKKN